MLRLGWENRITEYLPLGYFLPSVGQGALVIEARLGDKPVAELVSSVNHLSTWQSVMAERAFLRALGGGCRAPIAALGILDNGTLTLEGMAADASGEKIIQAAEAGSAMLPEEIGVRLAQKMLELGAAEFIAEVKNK
jgi:hydroxymethylbilane synthase